MYCILVYIIHLDLDPAEKTVPIMGLAGLS